jgi:hypothetical protein
MYTLGRAYGTHLTCVIKWAVAYCAFPSLLDYNTTFLMSMQACKKEELRSWVDHVGGPDAANYCAAAKLICCETGE